MALFFASFQKAGRAPKPSKPSHGFLKERKIKGDYYVLAVLEYLDLESLPHQALGKQRNMILCSVIQLPVLFDES